MTAFDLFILFERTNDIISSDIASITPAIGIEFGYIDLVYLRIGAGNFQNEMQYDLTERLSFQPNFGIGFNMNNIEINMLSQILEINQLPCIQIFSHLNLI